MHKIRLSMIKKLKAVLEKQQQEQKAAELERDLEPWMPDDDDRAGGRKKKISKAALGAIDDHKHDHAALAQCQRDLSELTALRDGLEAAQEDHERLILEHQRNHKRDQEEIERCKRDRQKLTVEMIDTTTKQDAECKRKMDELRDITRAWKVDQEAACKRKVDEKDAACKRREAQREAEWKGTLSDKVNEMDAACKRREAQREAEWKGTLSDKVNEMDAACKRREAQRVETLKTRITEWKKKQESLQARNVSEQDAACKKREAQLEAEWKATLSEKEAEFIRRGRQLQILKLDLNEKERELEELKEEKESEPPMEWTQKYPELKDYMRYYNNLGDEVETYRAMIRKIPEEHLESIRTSARRHQIHWTPPPGLLPHEKEFDHQQTAKSREKFFPGATILCHDSNEDRILTMAHWIYQHSSNVSNAYKTWPEYADSVLLATRGMDEDAVWRGFFDKVLQGNPQHFIMNPDRLEVGVGRAAWEKIGYTCNFPPLAVNMYQEERRDEEARGRQRHEEQQRHEARMRLAQKDRDLEQKDRDLAQKDRDLAQKDRELEQKREEIRALREQYKASPSAWEALLGSAMGLAAVQRLQAARQ